MISAPPPPSRFPAPARTPSDRAELADRRRFWVALWTPTASFLALVIVALVGTWNGCTEARSEARAMRSSVDALTVEMARQAKRVADAEERSIKARNDASEALAKARHNESELDSYRGSQPRFDARTDRE